MEKIKATAYTSPELEFIRYEYVDIITTSGTEGDTGNGYVPDDNVDDSW